MILLTGDLHGAHDIHKLTTKNLDRSGLTRDDYLIILGDFGLVWFDPPSKEDTWWLNYLEDAPWTTLVVLGNHENHALIRSRYKPEPWRGGRVRRFREHILQLVDNEIFEIEGRTFFVRGGAHSHDRHLRKPGKSWWPQEVPNTVERAHAKAKLQSAGWKVDYVLSHDAPADAHRVLYEGISGSLPDEYNRWLQSVADKLEFKRWFFGHHHYDIFPLGPLGKYTLLYKTVVDLNLNVRGKPTKHIRKRGSC